MNVTHKIKQQAFVFDVEEEIELSPGTMGGYD